MKHHITPGDITSFGKEASPVFDLIMVGEKKNYTRIVYWRQEKWKNRHTLLVLRYGVQAIYMSSDIGSKKIVSLHK